jgi:hypothetical protein
MATSKRGTRPAKATPAKQRPTKQLKRAAKKKPAPLPVLTVELGPESRELLERLGAALERATEERPTTQIGFYAPVEVPDED